MARMHSRKHGKSGSTKPQGAQVPKWVTYKNKEVELLVTKLAKEKKTASEIGIILRDKYGIPNVKLITKKTITQILTDKKLASDLPEDLIALIKRSIAIRKHLEENNQDQTAKRGLNLTDSKIKRLVRYYKQEEKLDPDWKYNPKQASLMIE